MAKLGDSVRRVEDDRLITGRGRYVDDIKLNGMLYVSLVRSPHAHALIKNVDVSAAAALPGVETVFTGADLQEQLGSLPAGWTIKDMV
ncbi:MAG: xanthine dehydrogenase family protein molybdopterin-binding subunit, partial [Chloroflexi bacterium]|nr:xanthine dehydrogenase family protein molybdopterin-binding subunit [Chloroflexota bacterium]